jgi:hypothetical protein
MKKTKRVLALFMVFVFAFTSLAIPTYWASATEIINLEEVLETGDGDNDTVQGEEDDDGGNDGIISPESSNRFEGNGFILDFNITDSWEDGYSAEVIITNTGYEDIENWMLEANSDLGFAFGDTVINAWMRIPYENAIFTGREGNTIIPAGGDVTFSFVSSHDGTIPIPTYYILTGDGFTSVIPEPGSQPFIQITSELPSEVFFTDSISIEYIAEPSEGAYIREVRILLSDGVSGRAVYLSGTGQLHTQQRGTLGQASVLLGRGENRIGLIVIDSAGLESYYVTEQVIYRHVVSITAPIPELRNQRYLNDGTNGLYVNNRITFWTVMENRRNITYEELVAAFATIEGTVIGRYEMQDFVVEVPPNDLAGLHALGQGLVDLFPDLFRSYNLDLLHAYSTDEGGGSLEESNFRTDDAWWNDNNHTWAINRIDLPRAWAVFGTQERQGLGVGIIDNGIAHSHPDLLIPHGNFTNHGRSDLNATYIFAGLDASQTYQIFVSAT